RIVSESTLSSCMTAVRAALGDNGEEQRLIRTMPRRGFRFVGTVSEDAEPEGGASGEHAPVLAAAGLLVQHGELPPEQGQPLPAVALRPESRRARAIVLLAASVAGLAAIVAATVLILRPQSQPPVSAPPRVTQRFDAAKVPTVTDEVRRSLATYPD